MVAKTNILTVLKDLTDLINSVNDHIGKEICLICYEKPSDFCHRHLVADWLNKNGFECKEYEF